MSKNRGISLDYIYEEDGVVRFIKSGQAMGFYFGKAGDRSDFRGFCTTDLNVAKALQICANKMVAELEKKAAKNENSVTA